MAFSWKLHDHHEVVEPMFAPATQLRHMPIPEAGAQRHGHRKAHEFRFQLHRVDSVRSSHSWLWKTV
jgi:hypothetical protein